jgi:5-methylcytosine-specific restriction protein A
VAKPSSSLTLSAHGVPSSKPKRPTYGRISGRKLQRIRHDHFFLYPLCVRCEAKGRIALAVELDHKLPLSQGGKDVESNRQGLCLRCHEEKTREDFTWKAKLCIGSDGFPVEE